MGVDRSDYLMIGYKLDGSAEDAHGNSLDELTYEDERFLPLSEGHENESLRIISDVMSGKYVMFGKLLGEADEYEGFGVQIIKPEDLTAHSELVKKRAIELLSDFGYAFGEPEIILFTNYH